MHVRPPNGAGAGTSREPRATWWWLGVLVVLGILVRVAFLHQPMRQDEADTVVLFALTPVQHILVDTSIPNNHILNSLLAKLAMGLFGNHPWVVRLPAFVAGVLVVPLTFFAGRALYSTSAGLIGAALAAASTPLVLYSTNARGYTLIAACSLGCLLCLIGAPRSAGPRAWLAFAVLAATGALVNPSMLYPAGGLVLWAGLELLAERPIRVQRLRHLALACAGAGFLALAAYAPAIAVSGWRSVVANDYVRPLAWGPFFRTLPGFAADAGHFVTAGWPMAVTAALAVMLAVAVVGHRAIARHRWSVALVMLAWALVLLLGMRRAPFPRVWLYLVPIFALATGAGVAAVIDRIRLGASRTRGGLVAVALTLWLGAGVVSRQTVNLLDETGVFPDGESIAEALAPLLAPGDRIAARWRAQGPVDYYLRERGVQARFAADGDTIRGRLFVVPAHALEETAEMVVTSRRLSGVDHRLAHTMAAFSRSAIWLIEPAQSALAPVEPNARPR